MYRSTLAAIPLTLFSLAISSIAHAAEFQHEATINYAKTDWDKETANYEQHYDARDISFNYRYSLSPVNTDNVILNEAVFLAKTSSINLGLSHYKFEWYGSSIFGPYSDRDHVNTLSLTGNWTTESDLFLALNYYAPISDIDGKAYSYVALLGRYINDTTLASLIAGRFREKDKHEDINETDDGYGLNLRSLIELNNQYALALKPFIVQGEDYSGRELSAMFYFNKQLGIEYRYLRIVEHDDEINQDDMIDIWTVTLNYHLNEALSWDLTFEQQETDGYEYETIGASISYRM